LSAARLALFADVGRALALRPAAEVMLVNGATTAICGAQHVLAGHTDKAESFAAARRAKFPDAPTWRLHATISDKHQHEARTVFPSVTDWWDKSFCAGRYVDRQGAWTLASARWASTR
jgi:hypothetical protein